MIWLNLRTNKKGVFLIYVFLVTLLSTILIAALATYLQTTIVSQRVQKDSIQALMQAREGIAYASKEAELHLPSWQWFTHDNNLIGDEDPNATVTLNAKATVTAKISDGSYDSIKGYYSNTADRFRVKTYPEARYCNIAGQWKTNGVTVILSQATIGQATRTLECRIGQSSLFKYFYFFPKDHEFGTATYNGHNLGSIHVNGDIILSGYPKFHFLSELSCGSDIGGKGFISRRLHRQYADSDDYLPEQPLSSSTQSPGGISGYVIYGMRYHFNSSDAEFKTGDEASPTTTLLPYTLSTAEASDAEWEWDKYYGSTAPDYGVHFEISKENLKHLAQYEMIFDSGGVRLCDSGKTITFTYEIGGVPQPAETYLEDEAFDQAFAYEEMGRTIDWDQFWADWQSNHTSDYDSYAEFADTLSSRQWERRYWQARYNVDNPVDWSSFSWYGVNWEWWKDLSYADERIGSDDNFPAEYLLPGTGESTDEFYLDTEEQHDAWQAWINSHAEIKAVVKDKALGGTSLKPIEPKVAGYTKKAKEGGILIATIPGLGDCNGDGIVDNDDLNALIARQGDIADGYNDPLEAMTYDLDDNGQIDMDDLAICTSLQGSTTDIRKIIIAPPDIDLEVANIIEETAFYNAYRPAREITGTDANGNNIYGSRYTPSNIMKIDVAALKTAIETANAQFNGIIYIDITEYPWSSKPSYDPWAAGVMLVNGEALPENGIFLATPNNALIKGNYNLDPVGLPEKHREADSQDVIDRVINNKIYIDSENDLQWRPSAVVTNRGIYTLSDEFPEPDYMPLADWFGYEYNVSTYYDNYNIITDSLYGAPGATWMPSTAQGAVHSSIDSWFDLMNTYGPFGQGPQTISRPGEWKREWIETNWGAWGDGTMFTFDAEDAEGNPGQDGVPDTYVFAQPLRQRLRDKISSNYQNEYQYVKGESDQMRTNWVDDQHIYNVAIVTPYETNTWTLERWANGMLTINGGFIQLPDLQGFRYDIPGGSYAWSSRTRTSSYPEFYYETRFGGDNPETPAGDILATARSSWRIIANNQF